MPYLIKPAHLMGEDYYDEQYDEYYHDELDDEPDDIEACEEAGYNVIDDEPHSHDDHLKNALHGQVFLENVSHGACTPLPRA